MKRPIPPSQKKGQERIVAGSTAAPTPTVSPTIKPNCTNCTHQATFSPHSRRQVLLQGGKGSTAARQEKEKSLLFSCDVLFCIFSDPLSQSLNRPLVPAQTSLASKVEDARKSGAVGEDLSGIFYFQPQFGT
ncbi:hypothetical protein CDAR_237941 [Caerostris darwini]|uniref:Uncharacterized protein n=1 Tax=Caerostris darwini TaxID=1538125 RepID=A0AAV4S162_9ARAC|nr:hypothetical protein CDAR_237941 [Caerostris darwini]